VVKAHLARLARVLANANEISLSLVFPQIWGFLGYILYVIYLCVLLSIILLFLFVNIGKS